MVGPSTKPSKRFSIIRSIRIAKPRFQSRTKSRAVNGSFDQSRGKVFRTRIGLMGKKIFWYNPATGIAFRNSCSNMRNADMPNPIQYKIDRFLRGEQLRTIDLFAGCGGFSLGFRTAGFSILGGIEVDPHAMASHSLNFGLGRSQEIFLGEHPLDIVKLDPEDYLRRIGGQQPVQREVDILVGGPPCQAFARIGRAKLREVAKDPNAYQTDKRADLFLEYVRFVDSYRPLAFVMENVPDMMNQNGVNVVANACRTLSKLGYICRYSLLNAAHYGVPQFRERVFIIGYHSSLAIVPEIPAPTHAFDLPLGYLGTRRVAMKPIFDSNRPCPWLAQPKEPSGQLPKAVSCKEAICDLPSIVEHLLDEGMPKGARRLDRCMRYSRREESTYGRLMRTWPGYATSSEVSAHVIRSLPRDYETFARMKPGDQYPEAYEVAVKIFEEKLKQQKRRSGASIEDLHNQLWSGTVPPYDPGKFPNKWWKLDPKKPSKTLTAHIGKDTYSHIHYDSKQARTISVREAARLQSFPDGFIFAGAMNAAFRQIGNAVPPLLALAIANTIHKQLLGASRVGMVSSKPSKKREALSSRMFGP